MLTRRRIAAHKIPAIAASQYAHAGDEDRAAFDDGVLLTLLEVALSTRDPRWYFLQLADVSHEPQASALRCVANRLARYSA